MRIINLTQHSATDDQIAAGVFDHPSAGYIRKLLTFDALPDGMTIVSKAVALACQAVVYGADCAMIGGAPYLMATLERALIEHGITPVYAFSVRESVETVQPDGSVVKTAVFKHAGFIEVSA